MKQNITKHIISLSLLLTIFISQTGLVLAQDAFTSAGKSLYTLPDNAVEGSTDERRNAYNNLSTAEQAQVRQMAQDFVNNATPTQEANRSLNLSFVDKLGNNSEITTEASVEDSSDFYGKLYTKAPAPIIVFSRFQIMMTWTMTDCLTFLKIVWRTDLRHFIMCRAEKTPERVLRDLTIQFRKLSVRFSVRLRRSVIFG